MTNTRKLYEVLRTIEEHARQLQLLALDEEKNDDPNIQAVGKARQDYARELMRDVIEARFIFDELKRDAERLDWVDQRRVLIARANTKPEQWKVETMDGPFIRPHLRAAIDAALGRNWQPQEIIRCQDIAPLQDEVDRLREENWRLRRELGVALPETTQST